MKTRAALVIVALASAVCASAPAPCEAWGHRFDDPASHARSSATRPLSTTLRSATRPLRSVLARPVRALQRTAIRALPRGVRLRLPAVTSRLRLAPNTTRGALARFDRAAQAQPVLARGESAAAQDNLHYHARTGVLETHVVRSGRATAAVTVKSGQPRVLASFPAGNSVGAISFERFGANSELAVERTPEALIEGDEHGVAVELRAATDHLLSAGNVRDGVFLGGMRFFRDRDEGHVALPDSVTNVTVVQRGSALELHRPTLDGHQVRMRIQPLNGGRARVNAAGRIELRAGRGQNQLRFRVTTLVNYRPLEPIAANELFRPGGAERLPEDKRAGLAMLSYQDKFLAGMPRFATYFGRDTLTTLNLNTDVLSDTALGAGIGSVLSHLGPEGEASHEETIGEYATWLRDRGHVGGDVRSGPDGRLDDYAMLDTHFMVAPTTVRYLERLAPAARAQFLARRTAQGHTFADALRRNLGYVLARTEPFARTGAAADLLSLPAGRTTGNWRDSNNGIAGGRTPYDVNVVYAPAALEAAQHLYEMLGTPQDRAMAQRASQQANAWSNARRFFTVRMTAAQARRQVAAYAREYGVDPEAALASLAGEAAPGGATAAGASAEREVHFDAIALDEHGAPIPVMHTDVGARMLFGNPGAEELDQIADTLLAAFPAGLRTPAGTVISNPAMASGAVQRLLAPNEYHGANAVWPVQEALVSAGLARQLGRADLPAATRHHLETAKSSISAVIDAAPRTAEVYRVVGPKLERLNAMGNDPNDGQESSNPQLWTSVPSRYEAPAVGAATAPAASANGAAAAASSAHGAPGAGATAPH